MAASLRLASTPGATYAPRVGIDYASKYKSDWLLFLDDDTMLMDNAVSEVAVKVCCRDYFFLDQANFVMHSRIRGLGTSRSVLIISLLSIGVGTKHWIPINFKCAT